VAGITAEMAGDALGSSETLTRAVKLRSGAAMRPGGLDEGGRPAMELRRVGGGAGNPVRSPRRAGEKKSAPLEFFDDDAGGTGGGG